MIDHQAFRSSSRGRALEHDLVAFDRGGGDRLRRANVDDADDAVVEPPRARRSEHGFHDAQTRLGRQESDERCAAVARDERPPRPERRLGLEQSFAQAARARIRRPGPEHPRFPHDQMHTGAGLVEECRALERRLPGADHGDRRTGELGQVVVVARMRHGGGGERIAAGERGQHRRYRRELHVAGGHHDRAGGEDLARREGHLEALGPRGQRDHTGDAFALDGDELLLEPAAVADEQVDRDGVVLVQRRRADADAVVGERVAGPGRREVRGARPRLQVHADGHVVGPGVHGLTEDPHRDATIEEVCRDGQPVGAGADDHGSGGVGRRVH